jgi:hypothetical protein
MVTWLPPRAVLAMTFTPPRVIPLKRKVIIPPEDQIGANDTPTREVLLLKARQAGRPLPHRIAATPHGDPGCEFIDNSIDSIVDPP